ncbi:MAG TPA: transposase [Candidatus Udaeobacter sp.]|jgi:putative transposase|nr:transposase [Candidatus Udaeobacter sp.]
MTEPPRLPAILLPWEKSIIYFVTMCVKDRRSVLANSGVFDAMKASIAKLRKWSVLAGVVMPEHTHWIVSPVRDRDLSIRDFSHGFKRTLRKCMGTQSWEWQHGCFDWLLRSNENLWSKWIYVRDNPVRQGFVQKAEDWPYYLDFISETDPGSCQLPLQLMGVGRQ